MKNHELCDNEIISVRDKNIFLDIPVRDGQETRTARVNWLQLLSESFYVAGITYLGNRFHDVYEGTSDEWILQRSEAVGLKPIICSCYWSKEQVDELNRCRNLETC